jgi:hypothetical protein
MQFKRADWFARARAANTPPQAPLLPQIWYEASLEMERAYVAGALSASVVLAYALAEAAQRKGGDAESPEFDLLRERRNRVAHLDQRDYPDQATLEDWAQAAIRTALRLAYAAAWR